MRAEHMVKLRTAGFSCDELDNGAMIATPQMTAPQFVQTDAQGNIMLQTQRSVFHRDIEAALGTRQPTPGQRVVVPPAPPEEPPA